MVIVKNYDVSLFGSEKEISWFDWLIDWLIVIGQYCIVLSIDCAIPHSIRMLARLIERDETD